MLELSIREYKAEIYLRRFDLTVTLFYRNPVTEERIGYSREIVIRQGDEIIDQTIETRLKYGKLICTGFEKGLFSFEGKEISSNKNDENFMPDWKDIIENGNADLFIALGMTVFESAALAAGGNKALPLVKNSEGGKTNALPKEESLA